MEKRRSWPLGMNRPASQRLNQTNAKASSVPTAKEATWAPIRVQKTLPKPTLLNQIASVTRPDREREQAGENEDGDEHDADDDPAAADVELRVFVEGSAAPAAGAPAAAEGRRAPEGRLLVGVARQIVVAGIGPVGRHISLLFRLGIGPSPAPFVDGLGAVGAGIRICALGAAARPIGAVAR